MPRIGQHAGGDGQPADEEKLLRRDEIWFTEKKEDGSTELFSLADFKPKPRKDKSIKNGYLNGAYGALPVLGDILSE